MFPVPQYCICSPPNLVCFPFEINAIVPLNVNFKCYNFQDQISTNEYLDLSVKSIFSKKELKEIV